MYTAHDVAKLSRAQPLVREYLVGLADILLHTSQQSAGNPQSTYTYIEYHSVCPLVGIGTLPPPLSPASLPLPPEPGRGGAHSPAGEGLGESKFRRLEKKLSTLPYSVWHPKEKSKRNQQRLICCNSISNKRWLFMTQLIYWTMSPKKFMKYSLGMNETSTENGKKYPWTSKMTWQNSTNLSQGGFNHAASKSDNVTVCILDYYLASNVPINWRGRPESIESVTEAHAAAPPYPLRVQENIFRGIKVTNMSDRKQ